MAFDFCGIEPEWFKKHQYNTDIGGISLTGKPNIFVAQTVNPWFAGNSFAAFTQYTVNDSDTVAEAGSQFFFLANKGWATNTFKVGWFGVMMVLPGAASCTLLNPVCDIQPGVGGFNYSAMEADLNVHNQHYGDEWGEPQFPFAMNIYLATGGTKRATAGILINCNAFGDGNPAATPFNWGVVLRGTGGIRQGGFGDFTDGYAGLVIGGVKEIGIDMSGATTTNTPIMLPGGLPVTYGPPDSGGVGYRLLRVPN